MKDAFGRTVKKSEDFYMDYGTVSVNFTTLTLKTLLTCLLFLFIKVVVLIYYVLANRRMKCTIVQRTSSFILIYFRVWTKYL